MPVNCVLAIVFLCTFAVSRWIRTRRLKMPPGPPPDPFIGNLRQMAFDKQEERFAEWGRTYGSDVIHAKVFGRSMVILNSLQAARDLMEKRSLNYSCRPRLVLIVELMGWDSVITNLPYGDRFRKHRRLIQDHFSAQAIVDFRSLQRKEAYTLLEGLFETPDDFIRHIRRFAAGTIMKIAYGHTVKSVDELYVRLAEEAGIDTVTAVSPGAMLVDFFPVLKYIPSWMPGAGFKRHALGTRAKVRRMLDAPFQMVQSTLAAGTAVPSFTSGLLTENDNSNDTPVHDDEDIKGIAGVLYAAATDTTSAIVISFILSLVRYPEVLKKAQAEIDAVVGLDRLPDFDDRASLPYVESLIKEVYRWSAPVPLGLPHRCMNDDQYRGYDIPADTIVFPNIWAMTRDESVYPDAGSFVPERFMGPIAEKAESTDPRDFVFGFGRRYAYELMPECPGKLFADANIWLIAACVIATFDVFACRDETGEAIIPPAEFSPGFVRHPVRFNCNIKPRSQRSHDTIQQALNWVG
ncbi:cytochrome P450 [Artomyces pyxidatus]|uniref:Cytochrome P450 n=1 Tax=Artomyces pyxidatus TaxID=48021 RepID=A0ACB8SVG3_9AGAM|nr:cytochrome P450 [Artomyces pyxidatus]